MKHLLLLSFLLNISCIGALKSMMEDTEEDNNDKDSSAERKEGQRQGDCTDGEDNDEDGAVDCDDSGCFDKPVCEGEIGIDSGFDDTGTENNNGQVDFYGQASTEFTFSSLYQEQGYNNCQYVEIYSAAADSVTVSPCSGCSILGKVDVIVETNCDFYEEGSFSADLAIKESFEAIYFYSPSEGNWIRFFSEDNCNELYNPNLSASSFSLECQFDAPNEYSSTSYLNLNWD